MTHLYRKLALAAGLALALPYATPAVATATPSAGLFDERISAGLPQSFSLPRPVDDERGQGIDEVVIEERLDTDVVFPDGSHAVTYVGTVDGRQATFTRLGDTLSVLVLDESTPDVAKSSRARRAAPPQPSDASTPRELQFWIFLHDNSGEKNYAKFHNWYLGWWIRDMERTVKPGIPVKVIVRDSIPGVTDFDYHRGTATEALLEFRNVADTYFHNQGMLPSGLNKAMLFIGDRPDNWDGAYGKALQGDTAAMASGTGPSYGVAHEFGHTLGALDEYAQNRFFCVTNMGPYTFIKKGCLEYSGDNDKLIREHVRTELARHSDD
jgi:hypothetical protein